MLHRSLLTTRVALAAAGLCLAVPACALGQATEPSPWLVPQTLSPDASANDRPELVMTPGGATAMTWRSAASQVMATVREPGGTTRTAAVNGDLVPTSDSDVAVNDAGDAIVVFSEQSGTYARVFAAFRPAGGAWRAPEAITTGEAEHAADPDVALDAQGNAVVVWSTSASGGSIRSALRAAGGAVGPVETITGPSGAAVYGSVPQVAVSGAGEATVAFGSSSRWETSKLTIATRPAGKDSTFAEGAVTDTGSSEPLQEVQVRSNRAGDTLVSWLESSNGWRTKIRAIHRGALALGSGPVLEVGGAAGYGIAHDGADVALGHDGNAVALWHGSEGNEGAAYSPATGWAPDSSVSTARPLYGVTLAAGADGDAIAAWTASLPGGVSAIEVSRRTAGAWGAPQDVADGGYSNQSPLAGIDDEGNAAVTWRHLVESGSPARHRLRLFDAAAPQIVDLVIPTTVPVGKAASFLAGSTDRMSGVTVSWDFGDGSDEVEGRSVTHTFSAVGKTTVTVSAVDGAGRTANAIARTVEVIDTIAPETRIDSAPARTKDDPSVTFSATDNAAGALSFACTLDGVPLTECASPQKLTGLDEGEHTFTVAATDAAGNSDGTPASATIVVDRTAPETTIGGAPSGPTKAAEVRLDLGSEPGATFLCSIGGGDFEACVSPFVLSGLPDGSYDLAVKALDEVGNADATPARATVVFDRTGPGTTFLSEPGAFTNEQPVSFSFRADEAGPSSSACTLDGVALDGCASPLSLPGMAEGRHTLTVRSLDALGNAGAPVSRTFTVDRTAPAATIAAPANGGETADTTPTLSGAAGRSTGDEPVVSWGVWAGEDLAADPLQQGKAAVGADGTWSATLAALPLGTYTALVTQYDQAVNYRTSTITFRVVAAPAAEPDGAQPAERKEPTREEPVAKTVEPKPATPGQPGSAPPAVLSVEQSVAQALVGSTGLFQRVGLKALMKAVAVPFPAAGPGVVRIDLLAPAVRARAAARGKARAVVVATGTRTVAAAGPTQVRVKSTRAGRRTLARAKSMRLTVRTSFTPKGSKAISVARKVTLKAKGRR